MPTKKEALEYFKEHNRPHPDNVSEQVNKYRELMSKLPELPAEPEPEPEKQDQVKEECIKTLRDRMDEKNQNALDVLVNEGRNEFLKHVFTDENGRERSYSEMRYLYG